MSLIQLAFLGALIGLPLGYALQRTKLCFNIAYREVILYGRTMLLRLIGLAVLIQMIGLALLIQFNVGGVSLNIVPFYLIAAMLGGFIFGLSMVYAEGCSSTVWYRVQIPNLSSMARMFATGLTMDLSANIAGGCNIGHGFTGAPTLALSSLTATIFTFLRAWLGNYWRFIRAQRIPLSKIKINP